MSALPHSKPAMNKHRHPLGSLVPVTMLGMACFVLGMALAAAVLATMMRQDRQTAATQLHAAEQRIALLTQALATQSDAVIDLSISPAPAQPTPEFLGSAATFAGQPTPSASPPLQVASGIEAPRPAAERRAATTPPKPSSPVASSSPGLSPPGPSQPARMAATQTSTSQDPTTQPPAAQSRPAAPTPDRSQAAQTAQGPAQPAPVSAEALAQARQRNRLEAVPPAKIGVDSVEAGAVRMLNGSVVGVGQRFPSGERLLSVDPQLREIVTDSRTILLL